MSGPLHLRPNGTSYYLMLRSLHRYLRPRTYLEIGFKHGRSAALALPSTRVIAVDPRPRQAIAVQGRLHLETVTSDEFFTDQQGEILRANRPVDLAFIDGLHTFDQVVRDFFNVARCCHWSSIVLIHDCLPRRYKDATSVETGSEWAGEVWKAVYLLTRERRDLRVCVSSVGPTGLAVIAGFREGLTWEMPAAPVCRKYSGLTWQSYTDEFLHEVDILPPTWSAVRGKLDMWLTHRSAD